MLRYALEASLCIRVLRERSPDSRARFNAAADELSMSTIVLTDLLRGPSKAAR